MTTWDARATKDLVESYYRHDWLTRAQAAELEDLVDRGAPDLALEVLSGLGPTGR